jgi:hypothetical protein
MKKVITVDWDDTLFEDPAYKIGNLWAASGSEAEPIDRVHKFIKNKHEEGYEIHVVSFRNERDKGEMVELAQLYNLPIKTFTCTEGKTKTTVLKNLRSELHIDDSVEVLVLAGQSGIKGLLVNCNQQEINSTSGLFEKI